MRIKSWVKAKKTDDYVLTKLKLNELSDIALMEHANFKIFEQFKIAGWLKEQATTTKAWKDLGLDRLSVAEVLEAAAFSTYVQYVLALNEKAKKIDFHNWKTLFGGGSETEFLVKVTTLVRKGRGITDLKLMVGSGSRSLEQEHNSIESPFVT
ncbi:hypothetical protein F441_09281 [Phytophthora nicotianae CJ01A1]|uniref:RxLR effector protein n=2 Tax=Phytophthora nicotianae TaxID=4792 RepID=W2WZW8_PHYNI|nr:hypothetical protein F441_09281 [Phytophthora nicotianae CJ01A1]